MGWLRGALGRLKAEPPSAPVMADWMATGNAALAAGDIAEAARCYGQGVLAHPDQPLLRLNLGYALLEQGRFVDAEEQLLRSLALPAEAGGAPFSHEARFLLARAQREQGRSDEALSNFEAAVLARPDFVPAIEEVVRTLHVLQRHAQAADWAARLVAARPDTLSRLVLANELGACGRDAEAADLLTQVVATEPGNADAHALLGAVLFRLRRFDEALAISQRLHALKGADADVLADMAAALHKLGRLDEALARLGEALALDPQHRAARANQVTVLLDLLRIDEAMAAARQGLQLVPDDGDLHWSLAIAHLLRGEFAAGWAEHEWRARSTAYRGTLPQFHQPRWNGESLQGRTIYLYGEQGFGDCIQFVRFVHEVAARAASVLLAVPALLEPLMPDLAPNCRLLRQGESLPPFDVHCPLMSLPAVLGTTRESIPAQVPYLHADPARVALWRERLGTGAARKVGIVWSGNPSHTNDLNRSMPLATFARLAESGCRFVNLQPRVRPDERPMLAAWPDLLDAGPDLHDFADTAALVSALDLVISVDTSVAHLAGALAKPVWILLPHVPDWRWLLEGDGSPWYPSARLYRQPVAGDWASVIARVRDDLLQP